ncbi:hypothetical protein EJ08DRAFT_228917 [Tothia fuscella]|uniref:M serotype protein n=1 Tax=Tothia fuscella TaxID=1048955 RepID=A0A9P4P409_9PEZI|nr:hypothetical protein EJ08DRAFT_228917 [Tothia fuscella]
MSANIKKPPAPGASGRASPAPGGPASPGATPRSATTRATPTTPVRNGLARNRSTGTGNGTPISARAAVKKPTSSGLGNSTSAAEAADVDDRIETAALVEELKERLSKTEAASDQFQKQIEILQSRFDDALKEQGKLEDKLHEEEERTEGLENEKRESIRARRDLEAIYETERVAAMKEKEMSSQREEELQTIIHRLKESISQQRESRPGMNEDGKLSRNTSSPQLDSGQFAPPSSLQRSNSKNNSKLIMQKDKLIESLRLELAESQIKLVEMENMGGGRMQELERTLLETRMTNARLMEDNESYQLLLSEKTLNGDFSRNDILRNNSSMNASEPSTSLADELSSAGEADQDGNDSDARVRRLESDVNALKGEKQALTLYINKIIERILQHQGGFENILSNQDEDEPSIGGAVKKPLPPKPTNKDKELPPPPPPKENVAPPLAPPEGQQSFLQRATSIARGTSRPRQRPMSSFGPPKPPGVTEDPSTAPSIPLSRTKSNRMSMQIDRRNTVDWNSAAATVVGNMYRGPSGEHAPPQSPGLASPRNSFFALRTPSGNNAPTISSIKETAGDGSDPEDNAEKARKSALDALNGGGEVPTSTDAPSPPRSVASREDRTGGGPGGAAKMTGNKMRPLRLVQEAKEEDKQKAGNRSSWIPTGVTTWLNKGTSPNP